MSIAGKVVKNIVSLSYPLKAHLTFKPHLQGRKDKMLTLNRTVISNGPGVSLLACWASGNWPV